jgi:hypothetical protein
VNFLPACDPITRQFLLEEAEFAQSGAPAIGKESLNSFEMRHFLPMARKLLPISLPFAVAAARARKVAAVHCLQRSSSMANNIP